jgi:hypothetical protein
MVRNHIVKYDGDDIREFQNVLPMRVPNRETLAIRLVVQWYDGPVGRYQQGSNPDAYIFSWIYFGIFRRYALSSKWFSSTTRRQW